MLILTHSIVALLGVFVVAPKLVQDAVGDVTVEFKALDLSQLQTDSIFMNATGTIANKVKRWWLYSLSFCVVVMKSKKMLGFIAPSATIDATQASLFYNDALIFIISMPEISLTSKWVINVSLVKRIKLTIIFF